MNEVTQFCIGLQDKPGLLAQLCSTLQSGGVNIQAIFVSGDTESCWVNIVVDNPENTERVLKDNGHNFFSEKVLSIGLSDRPGELERVASKLAEAEVNINYVYGSSPKNANFNLILNVSDVARAKDVLASADPTPSK